MSTLVECMTVLLKKGFEENFSIKESGLFSEDGQNYKPEDVKIIHSYRFAGEADPGHNAFLYAIETRDGKKGLISDAFDPYSIRRVAGFMNKVNKN